MVANWTTILRQLTLESYVVKRSVIGGNQNVNRAIVRADITHTLDELLVMAGRLLESIMYADDSLCESWSNAEVVLAVLEARKQLG